MNNIKLEEKDALDYIRNMINNSKIKNLYINDAKYHHNTGYYDASSIIKYGICSINRLQSLGIKTYSKEMIDIISDKESHVNGDNEISLSVVGLTDLYPNEEEYDPYYENVVDFLVSNEVKTYRTSTNYGNEYLAKDKIEQEYIKSIDIRILKHLEKIETKKSNINSLIDNYNHLLNIALTLKNSKLDIPIREMVTLETDLLWDKPKILLKENR